MIFGISDRSLRVTWRTLGGMLVVFAALLISHRLIGPTATQVICVAFAGLFAAGFVLLVGLYGFRRHPASRIARLLQAGRVDEACSLGASFLEKTPDDPLVQLNCVAAYVAAGWLERARQILETVRRDRLRGQVLDAYLHWVEKLKPTTTY